MSEVKRKCSRCKRPLRGRLSLLLGVGPICWKRQNISGTNEDPRQMDLFPAPEEPKEPVQAEPLAEKIAVSYNSYDLTEAIGVPENGVMVVTLPASDQRWFSRLLLWLCPSPRRGLGQP